MNQTKQQILDVSLELFAQRGFTGVSVGDICEQVNIQKSSLYYHFTNKQAIFDELLSQFTVVASTMMGQLESELASTQNIQAGNFYTNVCDYYFEKYLMDDFCNKIMRFLCIEQFNNEYARQLYERWLYVEPIKFQEKVFGTLITLGLIKQADAQHIAVRYYAPIFFYAQRWLFSGTLSEENKNHFRVNAYKHIELFFKEMRGA